jgi:hypothetical protein
MHRTPALLALIALAGCGAPTEPVAAPAPTPSGTLFLSGRDPGVLIRVDAATETVFTRTGVRQMGGGDPPYMLHFTGGRLVTFALGRASSFAPDLRHPKSLGEAWFWVPSSTPGRIWNILRTPHSNVTFRGVREVTADGRVTFARRWRLPGWPVGAVEDGIVLQKRRLEVWDPATRRRVRRLPGGLPVAFRGPLVASCGDPCDTLWLNERPVHGRFDGAWRGAFSPDGKLLAVGVRGRRLAIVDVDRGIVTLMPGARRDSAYGRITWSSSGWLLWNAGGGRIGAWRPGAAARRLGVTVGSFTDMTSD